jgi:CRISPR/Cas system CSM-associated protein Csm2 small subunit
MEDKKVQIRITEDGKFYAETIGVKGKECLSIIEVLEELLDAETVDSDYTEEYYEPELKINKNQKVELKGE